MPLNSFTPAMGKSVKNGGWIITRYKTKKNGKTVYKVKKVRK